MASDITAPAAAPQKMSRYRTVRRAQEQQQSAPPMPPMPPMPAMPDVHMQRETPDSNIGRSMSRYHRRPPTAHATSPNAAPLRAKTAPQAAPPPQTTLPPSTSARHRALSTPQQWLQTANNIQALPRTAKHRDRTEALPRDPRQQAQQHEDSSVILQKERERQRVLKERLEAEARVQKEAKRAEAERLEKLRREEEEAARLQAEREAEEAAALKRQKEEEDAEKERGKRLRKAEAQKMIDHRKEEERRAKLEKENRARLEEKSRAFLSQSPASPVSPPRKEGFSLFKRRKDEGLSLSSEERPTTARPRTASQPNGNGQSDTITPGGGGAVLGIDAPTSAINGGDRRVTVVYNKRRIQLPVTPTTTPLDLFKSADVILAEPVPVRTAVLMEWFRKVDIKRPLRNYEYVRDVMNSWDSDEQNDLIIVDSAVDSVDQDELLSYACPDRRPEGMSCMINYSSRPGKWAKRWLCLRPDGQLTMAKNDRAKEENVCHLSDYDIYTVTQKKIARINPPKKICFAVKSLQKSNIFADESQYVHFFCTNDKSIADTFWKALQSWRSWYLKYQLGEGLKKSPATEKVLNGTGILASAPLHSRGESVGSHYQLGAFTSLIDMSDFNKKLDEIEIHKPGEFPDDAPLSKLGGSQAMHARRRSVRAKQPPPTSRGLAALATSNAPEDNTRPRQNSNTQSFKSQDEETFATGGLLGRSYSTRKQAVQDREQKQNGAFTEGPSLVGDIDRLATQGNGSGLHRSSSTRSNHHRRTSSDIRRTASKRIPGMPQPLIDLTPQYRPPPQFVKQGKGYNPGAGAGPLVESATSIEEAIQVPSSTDWRARPRPTYGPGANERTKSLKGRGEPLAAHTFNNHSGAPQDDNEAFTGGLLSTAGYAQGHATVGRGVMDGSKARKPMLNFGDEDKFQSGSLLANISGTGPVIDRSGR